MQWKYVYIMSGTKWHYKLGISNNPNRRLKEVAHNPKFVARYRFLNAERVEAFMHKRFARDRVKRSGSGGTEWFKLGLGGMARMRSLLFFLKVLHDGTIGLSGVSLVILTLWLYNQM